MKDNDIVDASQHLRYTPPFTHLNRYGKPSMWVKDSKGLPICLTYTRIGHTLTQMRDHARLIAEALNKIGAGDGK